MGRVSGRVCLVTGAARGAGDQADPARYASHSVLPAEPRIEGRPPAPCPAAARGRVAQNTGLENSSMLSWVILGVSK